jgi:hypothetical protein
VADSELVRLDADVSESEPTSESGAGNPRHAAVAAAFAVFFLLLFSQFPLAGRLPGNCDTWYAIAFTNVYLNETREALGLGRSGSFLYPAENPFSYGETSVALAIVPMLLRLLGLPDLAAYYLFLSLVYAATAFSVYLVATLYLGDRLLAAFAGLSFAASNFLLSTIDSPHTAFCGVAFLSLYLFKRFLLRGRASDLRWAALLAGAQVYFSAYVFALLAAAVALVALSNWRTLFAPPRKLRTLVLAAAMTGALIAPFSWFYKSRLTGHFSWRAQAVLFAEFNSIDPQDLLNPMPGNLLYPEGHRFNQRDAVALQKRLGRSDPSFQTEEFALLVGARPREDEESLWVSSRRRAFIGVLPYLLALVAARRGFAGRGELIALFVAGVVMALGPGFTLGERFVPMPLYWLYQYAPGFHMFRIPGRAFTLSLLAVEVAAAKGLELLLARFAHAGFRRRAAVLAMMVLVLLENLPFPMRSFEGERFARPSEDYLRFLTARRDAVILNLPSGIGYGLAGSADDLYVFNRELIYMNWQTYHRHDIVNGVNGYIPLSRIELQRLIMALPGDEAVAGLRELGVQFLVVNKEMFLPGELPLTHALRASRKLVSVLDTDTIAVFAVRR